MTDFFDRFFERFFLTDFLEDFLEDFLTDFYDITFDRFFGHIFDSFGCNHVSKYIKKGNLPKKNHCTTMTCLIDRIAVCNDIRKVKKMVYDY